MQLYLAWNPPLIANNALEVYTSLVINLFCCGIIAKNKDTHQKTRRASYPLITFGKYLL